MYLADMASSVPSAPPSFVRLAGHPVRWRLMGELALSDRRVRELVRLLDQPQNLVSYHLGRLRSAGLVGARRSTFDARDSYYHLDLAGCADGLAAAGLALHPGLRLAQVPAAPPGPGCRVLFLCTGNSARSPVAEALLRRRASGAPGIEVTSAGSRPKPLHPNAVRVLGEHGIDLAGRTPQHLSALERQRFDYVITLCDRVREVCPDFPGPAQRVHWSIPDPATGRGTDEDTYPAFRRMAAELETRIGFLLAAAGAAPASVAAAR
jgi:ArsR family transcriptional regulator, arsenate/arsenite/antimonite-responsive transcriptional repressor / arsenate reductase (thioredoxin)